MSCKARITIGIAGGDADVLPGEGQHEQRQQRVVLDRSAAERLMQRIGAEIADHLHALAGHLGPRLRTSCVGSSSEAVLALALLLRRAGMR